MPRIIPPLAELIARRDETAVEKTRRDAALIDAYHACFATEDGQAVLADLLRRCGYFSPNGDDRSAGKRDMGIHIINMLRLDAADMVRFAVSTETESLL